MKTNFLLLIICVLILLSHSCSPCKECTRYELEAQCIQPGDTIIFNQDIGLYEGVQRFYTGGDSVLHYHPVPFDTAVQRFREQGYSCTIKPTGNFDVWNNCQQNEDDAYAPLWIFESRGYSCCKKIMGRCR